MLLVCLIWGFNFSITKSAFDQIPPLAFTAIRFAISSLLLWLVLRVVEGPAKLPPGAWRRLVLLGVVGNTFTSWPSCWDWPAPPRRTARSSCPPCLRWWRFSPAYSDWSG